MPANVYEGMFLLDPSKVAGDVANADKQVRSILERHHAEVLVSRPWDERRLTYPIKNLKKGLYYLTYFSAEGKALSAIEHDCKLSEMIVRQLILRVPAKLVDTMLALAKGEHAVALQGIHEEPAMEGTAAAIEGIPELSDAPRRPKHRSKEQEKD